MYKQLKTAASSLVNCAKLQYTKVIKSHSHSCNSDQLELHYLAFFSKVKCLFNKSISWRVYALSC